MSVVYSKELGLTKIIKIEPDSKCELCGKTSELRPYGPHGENICFECGMKDEEKTKEMYAQSLRGVDNIMVILPEGTSE